MEASYKNSTSNSSDDPDSGGTIDSKNMRQSGRIISRPKVATAEIRYEVRVFGIRSKTGLIGVIRLRKISAPKGVC